MILNLSESNLTLLVNIILFSLTFLVLNRLELLNEEEANFIAYDLMPATQSYFESWLKVIPKGEPLMVSDD